MSFMASTMLSFSPKQLFRAGEKGVWYDPSDMSTLWQDSARTTAVTAVEQPVGCIDDKSGNGFNATQSTSASRPVLSARYNLLTKTEAFSDAVWSVTSAANAISADQTAAPDGTTTADKLTAKATTGLAEVYNTSALTIISGQGYTFSVAVKKDTNRYVSLVITSSTNNQHYMNAIFDLDGGGNTATQTATGTSSGTITSTSQSSLGNGWYRLLMTGSIAQTGAFFAVSHAPSATGVTLTNAGEISRSWAGTESIYIWGADLRGSNDGVGLPAYQRVNTSTDYDTAGFPMYLKFDGTDDSLSTGTISPGSVDTVQIFGGVRNLAGTGTFLEYSANGYTTSGGFNCGPGNATGAQRWGVLANAGSGIAAESTLQTLPYTSVVSWALDTAQSGIDNEVKIRVNQANQTLVNKVGTDSGTGNFTNNVLYIGARTGTVFYLNGRVYGVVIRFSADNLAVGQLADTEGWMNSRTRAY